MDAVLAGAGTAMAASYFSARAEAARPDVAQAPTPAPPRHEADVQVSPPRVVRPGDPNQKPPSTATPGTPAKPPVAGHGGKPPVNEPPGNLDPGAVLGGISRRPDASVPVTVPPPPSNPPDAAPATTPPPSVFTPDAAVAPPPPPPDPTDAEQSLANGVQRTVEGHMAQVRRCWENVAKSSADSNLPEGTIEIQFAVLANGNPSSVQMVQNATGSPQLGDCVVALVNSWSFPSHDGDPVVFVWPFFFKASK